MDIFAKWDTLRHPAGALVSRLLPAAVQVPKLQSAHRYLAATPGTHTNTQVPKHKLNI